MRVIFFISRLMSYVTAGVLFLMMMLTVADILMRYLLGQPIIGVTELTAAMMVAVVFPSLAWCALRRKHVNVTLLVAHFPPRIRIIIESISLFVALVIWIIITWRTFLFTMTVQNTFSQLKFPMFPFYWIVTVGSALLCLAIVNLLIQSVSEVVKK